MDSYWIEVESRTIESRYPDSLVAFSSDGKAYPRVTEYRGVVLGDRGVAFETTWQERRDDAWSEAQQWLRDNR